MSAGAPFALTEPYDEGMLDVGDGNLVHWNMRGNPDGKPAVIVHGGPGSGSATGTPRAFHPDRYRLVGFDQRGCGRSTPSASDPATDLRHNTTEHLLADMERLRVALDIERWLVFGGSWGSTLALAYAERHPHRVRELVLASMWFLGSSDVDWLYRGGLARVFPEQWERFAGDIDGDVVAAYVDRMADPDPDVRTAAAQRWTAWEDAVLSLEPNGRPSPFSDRPAQALQAFVRICSHYVAHTAWLEEGALLRDASQLAGVPGVIIHGRHDLSCPAQSAWRLAQAWPDAELFLIDDAGHKGSPASNQCLYDALDRFSALPSR